MGVFGVGVFGVGVGVFYSVKNKDFVFVVFFTTSKTKTICFLHSFVFDLLFLVFLVFFAMQKTSRKKQVAKNTKNTNTKNTTKLLVFYSFFLFLFSLFDFVKKKVSLFFVEKKKQKD